MLEYVLFSTSLRDRFTRWLEQNQIDYETGGDEEQLLILIDEDIDEDTEEKIEERYDLLLDESAKITDAEDDAVDSIHLVGIQFTRSDGSIGMARISPELANRIQSCLDPIELQAFVQTVVDAVEDTRDRRLCETE